MTTNTDSQNAKLAITFLMRSTMRGDEVGTFIQTIRWLEELASSEKIQESNIQNLGKTLAENEYFDQ